MVSGRNQRLLPEFDRAGLRPALIVQPAGSADLVSQADIAGPAAETQRGDC